MGEGKELAAKLQAMLGQVLVVSSSPTPEAKKQLTVMSKGCAESIKKISLLTEKLKGQKKAKQPVMMVAEDEMKKAAESIEKAGVRLAELKLKRHVIGDEEEVGLTYLKLNCSGFTGQHDHR